MRVSVHPSILYSTYIARQIPTGAGEAKVFAGQYAPPTCNTLIKCGREFPVSIFSAMSFGLDLNTAAVFNAQVCCPTIRSTPF